jgi:lipopolysaccharide/colanic/teichoic acid biosynthesis glycosyltransferase
VIRALDFIFSLIGLVLGFPVLLLLWLLLRCESGSPIFLQERVGRYKIPFKLIKFRTMGVHTASVATHLVNTSSITTLGRYLRRAKLDELPQLVNVLRGDMSLVGPRPCLYSQEELIYERSVKHVFSSRPGITGLAQIQGVDMSTPKLLAQLDKEMLDSLTPKNYFRYIILTVTGKGMGDRIRD